MGLIRYMKRQASLYVQFIKQGILGTGKDHHSLHLSEVLLSIVQVWLRCSYSIMADGVRFLHQLRGLAEVGVRPSCVHQSVDFTLVDDRT